MEKHIRIYQMLPGDKVKIFSTKNRHKVVSLEQFKFLQESYVGLVEWVEKQMGDTGIHFKTDFGFAFTLGRSKP